LKQQKRTAKAQRKAQPRSEEDSAQQEEARPEPTNQLSALKQKFRQRRTHNEPQLAKKSAEKRDTKRQRAEKQGQNDDREDGGGDKGEVSDELLMQVSKFHFSTRSTYHILLDLWQGVTIKFLFQSSCSPCFAPSFQVNLIPGIVWRERNGQVEGQLAHG